MIKPEKQRALAEKMSGLNINEADLIEKFILGSGSGGQKINKTASTVYLKHAPTGIEVKCQTHRSREHNRYEARKRLCEKIIEQNQHAQSLRQQTAEKIRRQKQRRSRRQQQKRLDEKKRLSQKKSTRKTPSSRTDD